MYSYISYNYGEAAQGMVLLTAISDFCGLDPLPFIYVATRGSISLDSRDPRLQNNTGVPLLLEQNGLEIESGVVFLIIIEG